MLGFLGGSQFLGQACAPRRSFRAFQKYSPAGRLGLLAGLFGSRRARPDLFTPIARAHAQRQTNRRARMRKEKARRRAQRAESARSQREGTMRSGRAMAARMKKRSRDRRIKMARK